MSSLRGYRGKMHMIKSKRLHKHVQNTRRMMNTGFMFKITKKAFARDTWVL